MMTPSDYLNLYNTCRISSEPLKVKEIESVCLDLLKEIQIYQIVQSLTHIPWVIISVLHFRESNQSFKCHLHNGDPLTARTIHTPQGRPEKGNPPFTWIESAVDALTGIWRPKMWGLANCLEFLERYNGLSYQKKGIHTPYLWDYTNLYSKGLFVADAVFDPAKGERRPGCVPLIKTLSEKGISLDFSALDTNRVALH